MVAGTLETTDALASGREAASSRRDDGSTFIEIMVSIVLIGIVVIGILAAVRVNIKASSLIYDAADLETVLLNAADRIDRATIRDCHYENEVNAAAPDETWTITVVEHQRLVADPTGDPDLDWENCEFPLSAFDVERVTVRVTSPNGEISRTMMVVKGGV